MCVLAAATIPFVVQGSSAVDVFGLGASARGLGLGGAFVALVGDETAAVHNPAGLAKLDTLGFSSLYIRQFGGVTYGAMCVSMPGIGLSVSLVDSGMIPSPQGSFRYALQEFGVAAGVPLSPASSIGARCRLFRQSAPTTGVGWSLDPAVHVRVGLLRLGAVLSSAFSGPMRYASGQREIIPASLNVGVAAEFALSESTDWSLAIEAGGVLSRDPTFRAGMEMWFGRYGLRAGYDGHGLTVGASAQSGGLQLDWAVAVRTDLGTSHRVSLALRM
jgi:hypothetical protein